MRCSAAGVADKVNDPRRPEEVLIPLVGWTAIHTAADLSIYKQHCTSHEIVRLDETDYLLKRKEGHTRLRGCAKSKAALPINCL